MKDPVKLSGGNLGGQIVEGAKWKINTELEIEGLIYRRLQDDKNGSTKDNAVFVKIKG